MKNAVRLFCLMSAGVLVPGFLTIGIMGCDDSKDDNKIKKNLPLLLMFYRSTGPICQSTGPKRIFLSMSAMSGNLGGISGADAKCMTDGNKPAGSSVWKALIVGNSRSINSDWVLHCNTTYTRVDGTIIGKTDSQSVFTFPLTNSIVPGNPILNSVWTGLSMGWGNATTHNCNNWTNGTAGYTGAHGTANSASSSSMYPDSIDCDFAEGLYCVEQ